MSGRTSRARGRSRELDYLHWLQTPEGGGWEGWRIDGTADLIILRAGEPPWLLQVKSTLTPFAHFLPAERGALSAQAHRAGARCALIWWPKGYGLAKAEWIEETDWPTQLHRKAR